MPNLTRRDFIKTAALATLAMSVPIEVFAADNCTVKTRYGTFNGFVDKQDVKTWLGIPYAQPPVGKLRWQAPQPLKPSNKTFDAKKFGAARRIKLLTGTTADEWRYFLIAENLFEILRAEPKKHSPILSRHKTRTPQEIIKRG